MSSDELLIYADAGAWFQYRDEYGRIRTSYLGHCDSAEGLRRFAQRRGINWRLFTEPAKQHAARAAKAQLQGKPALTPA